MTQPWNRNGRELSSIVYILPFIVIALIAPFAAHAQYREEENRLERIADHTWSSVSEMAGWHDLPIAVIYYTKSYYPYGHNGMKPITIMPFHFEHEFAENVGQSGSSSLGSMDPSYIPNLVLLSRAAFNIGNDLFTEDGSTRDAYKHTFGFYKTMVYAEVATNLTKGVVTKYRPDGSDTKSFFSGHSAYTFAMSSYLQRELDESIANWEALDDLPTTKLALRIAAFSALYGWAGYVGYSRMHDNKHYFVDVLLGAGVGTLLGNLVFDAYLNNGSSLLKTIGIASIDGTPTVGVFLSF